MRPFPSQEHDDEHCFGLSTPLHRFLHAKRIPSMLSTRPPDIGEPFSCGPLQGSAKHCCLRSYIEINLNHSIKGGIRGRGWFHFYIIAIVFPASCSVLKPPVHSVIHSFSSVTRLTVTRLVPISPDTLSTCILRFFPPRCGWAY
jgi:hypothetical protein